MSIIALPLPSQIANGQAVDAVPLMSDLNYLAAQVNANAAAASAVPVFSGVLPFTPGLAFGGAAVGIVYTVRVGAYFKVQNIVFFTIDLRISSKGSSTGFATVTGLPVSINTNFPTGSVPIVPVVPQNITFASGYIAGFLTSPTSIELINPVTAAPFNVLDDTAFGAGSEVIITGFYSS